MTDIDATIKAPTKERKPRAKATPAPTPAVPTAAAAALTKLDRLTALLQSAGGATKSAMMTATGWQAHSVRGAMAGALKKRGLVITSDRIDGVRVYRAGVA